MIILSNRIVNLFIFSFDRMQPLSLVAKVEDFQVKNEPVLQYLKNSEERNELYAAIAKYKDTCVNIPIVIGNEEIFDGEVQYQVMVSIYSFNC